MPNHAIFTDKSFFQELRICLQRSIGRIFEILINCFLKHQKTKAAKIKIKKKKTGQGNEKPNPVFF